MSEHSFQLRLNCRYERPDNSVIDLSVENMDEGDWSPFDLNFQQPGFLIFVYAILNCQHLYFRTNAAERGLLLEAASGEVDVLADSNWVLQKLHVRFKGKLVSGGASAVDADIIADRMQHCPVSINLADVADTSTRVEFD